MIRALRAIVLAAVIAASLLGSGSVASADQGLRLPKAPHPAQLLDVTWE